MNPLVLSLLAESEIAKGGYLLVRLLIKNKTLSETRGDIVKAQEFLRKKSLASADKKGSRVTTGGRIGPYVHDSRISIPIEVNCETNFTV